MSSKSNIIFVVWLFVVVGIAATFYSVFPILLKPESDILSLLPKSDNAFADESIQQLSQSAGKDILILVQAGSSKEAITIGQEFELQLKSSRIFEYTESLQAEAIFKEGLTLYTPYRCFLLPEKTRQMLQTKGLPAGIQQSLALLQTPMSVFYNDFITIDPLFNVPLFIQESGPQNQNQIIDDGYLILKNENKYHFVINAKLSSSPFTKETHDTLMPLLKSTETNIKAKYPQCNIFKSGVVFFAERGSTTAQKEITWLGSISLLGVVFLMLIVFRSFNQVILSILAITIGVLTAITVTLLVFQKIHLITLTFGTSLIGISIDYSTHYFADNLIHRKDWSPTACLKRIGAGISWGAGTTLLAFIAVAFNPLPGLHQIAIFSIAGVIGAFFTVVAAFPVLLKNNANQKPPSSFIQIFFKLFEKFSQMLSNYKKLFWALVVLLIPALFLIKSDDDVRTLHTPPEDLMANEKYIHQMMSKIDPSRLVLIRGTSAENLLQKEEAIKHILDQLIQNNHLSKYIAVSQFVPSLELQTKNFELLSKSITNKETTFTEDEMNLLESCDFEETYQIKNAPQKLTPEVFFGNHFGAKFEKLFNPHSTVPFSIILLQSVKSDSALASAFSKHEDVFYINKTAQISDSLKKIREKIAISTIIAYSAIYLLLAFKHGFFKALTIVAVPAFAAMASLAILAFSGQSLHISHTLAIIIVLGTGIDYTIFFAESKEKDLATILAVTLSAMTSILSFGLLIFCQTDFLKGFGIIILIGVSLSYLLAPIFFSKKTQH